MIFGGAIDVGGIFGWGVAWCGALPGENEYSYPTCLATFDSFVRNSCEKRMTRSRLGGRKSCIHGDFRNPSIPDSQLRSTLRPIEPDRCRRLVRRPPVSLELGGLTHNFDAEISAIVMNAHYS